MELVHVTDDELAATVLELTRCLVDQAQPPRPVALMRPKINREVWDSMTEGVHRVVQAG